MASSLRTAALRLQPSTRPLLARPRASLPSWTLKRASHDGKPANPSPPIDVNTALSSPALLPAPGEGEPITLDVSGDGTTVKLDRIGPLVVNHDGSVGRLTNWAEMTKAEKKNTLRLLGRRNKQRLEALQAKRKQEKDDAGGQDSGSSSN